MLLLSRIGCMPDFRFISIISLDSLDSGFPGSTHVPKNLFANCQRNNMQELIIEDIDDTSIFFRTKRGKYTEVRYNTYHLSSADGLT